jgi:adenylosuccinate lyase
LCEIPLPQHVDRSTLFEGLETSIKISPTQDALWIKETEKVTNHDVKAIEYFIKEKFGNSRFITNIKNLSILD